MTTSEQMRRLVALEADAGARQMEADLETALEAWRPKAERMAKRLECRPKVLLEEAAASARRMAEIGEEAYLAEMAAEFGTTVEELRSGAFEARLERDLEEWVEGRHRRRAEAGVIVWHGGTPPIPYMNGEIVRDEHGEPLKFR